jgi:hypothetical protein
LGFANEDWLVYVMNPGALRYDAISPPEFFAWQREMHAFEAMGTYVWSAANLTGGTAPVRLRIADVTSNWFALLVARMQLGRGFLPGEEGLGAPKVAVLSDALWRGQFGADAGVVGGRIFLDGTPYTVVGVAEPHAVLPDGADLWRPMALPAAMLACRVCPFFWGPVARLRPGVSLEQARRELRTVATRVRAQFPASQRTNVDAYDLVPLRRHIVGGTRMPLLVSLGAVACLLLIACANVATLQLARATARSAELGIRIALGASRGRIILLVLTESVALALMGGVLGTLLAAWGVHALRGVGLGSLPLLDGVGIGASVVVVTVAVSAATGVLFGLAPALHAMRTGSARAVRSAGRGASPGRTALRLRDAFVVAQLSLAVPLVIAAALLGKSLARLAAVDPGFRPDNLVLFTLALPQCGTIWAPDSTCAGVVGSHYDSPAAMNAFVDQLVRRLRALPGTQAGDTKSTHLEATPAPALYRPFAQSPTPWITAVVRSTAPFGALVAAVRAQVASLDKAVPLAGATRTEDAIATSAAAQWLVAAGVGGFAATALLLAAVGVAGLIAYAMRERRWELGIRLALGARHESVIRRALGWGLRPAVIGLGIGVALSLAGSRVLRNLLYGVPPTDAATYGAVCGAFLAIALVASLIPAQRASRVDPMETLRAE